MVDIKYGRGQNMTKEKSQTVNAKNLKRVAVMLGIVRNKHFLKYTSSLPSELLRRWRIQKFFRNAGKFDCEKKLISTHVTALTSVMENMFLPYFDE